MKKIVISTFLITAGALSLMNISQAPQEQNFGFKNIYAMTLGYDKINERKNNQSCCYRQLFQKCM